MIRFLKPNYYKKLSFLTTIKVPSKSLQFDLPPLNYNPYHHKAKFFYSKTLQQKVEGQTQSQSPQKEIVKLSDIEQRLKSDILNIVQFKDYERIRGLFLEYIQKQEIKNIHEQKLIKVCHLISYYPKFALSSHVILKIYSIICRNMHLKSVEVMNQLLLFSLVSDQNVSQSPIFHQFIKFYLCLTLQEYKYKYKIDFEKMSLYEGIKKFFGRLVQKGFLSRTPLYSRSLNILEYDRTCHLLLNHNQTKDSLMIKKISFTKFMNIKQFYEQQMKQNLYNLKKVILMKKFDPFYLKSISKQIPMLRNESIYLRQLYMKLYLTIPDEQQMAQLRQQNIENIQQIIKDLHLLKYKNVIYLYQLTVQYVNKLNEQELKEENDAINLLKSFITQVQVNFAQLNNQEPFLLGLQLPFEQLLLIGKYVCDFQKKTKFDETILRRILQQFNAYYFDYHFDWFLILFKKHKNLQQIVAFIESQQAFSLLQMPQLSSLIQMVQSYPTNDKNKQAKFILISNIVKRIISIDFQVVTEILSIIQNISQNQQDINKYELLFQNAQDLSIFCLRYIADHHSEFNLAQFQKILILLINITSLKHKDFDDESNHYPLKIFDQINPYLQKMSLLLSLETKERLTLSKLYR